MESIQKKMIFLALGADVSFHYCPLGALLGRIYWREGMIKGRSLTGALNSLSVSFVSFLSKLVYMECKLGDWSSVKMAENWSNGTLFIWIPPEKAEKIVTIMVLLFPVSFALFLVFQVVFVVWSKSTINEDHIEYFYSSMIVFLFHTGQHYTHTCMCQRAK